LEGSVYATVERRNSSPLKPCPDSTGSDMRSIGGTELVVMQQCRCATEEGIMVKSAKTGTAKQSLRQVSTKNPGTDQKGLRQSAKPCSTLARHEESGPRGKQRQIGGHSVKPNAATTVRANSKLGKMIALLQRQDGATIAQMMKATGWQAHSVRGAMSGTIKKRLGLTITSDTQGTDRTYRIVNGKG
jgi:hypothetical protein